MFGSRQGWLVDILVATNGKSPTVYKNGFNNSNHYLQIDLDGPAGNLEGIGARVIVETAAGSQMQEVVLGSHYLSQQPSVLHFGLGSENAVTSVTVTCPALQARDTIGKFDCRSASYNFLAVTIGTPLAVLGQ